MEALGVTSGIIAITQLMGKLIGYVNDVIDAPKERDRCTQEAANFSNLLNSLKYEVESGGADEPWSQAIRALGSTGGPLDQFRQLLRALVEKFEGEVDRKKVGKRVSGVLTWKFNKEEIGNLLARIERLKTFVLLALLRDAK